MKLAIHKLALGEKLTRPRGLRLGRLIIFRFSGVQTWSPEIRAHNWHSHIMGDGVYQLYHWGTHINLKMLFFLH